MAQSGTVLVERKPCVRGSKREKGWALDARRMEFMRVELGSHPTAQDLVKAGALRLCRQDGVARAWLCGWFSKKESAIHTDVAAIMRKAGWEKACVPCTRKMELFEAATTAWEFSIGQQGSYEADDGTKTLVELKHWTKPMNDTEYERYTSQRAPPTCLVTCAVCKDTFRTSARATVCPCCEVDPSEVAWQERYGYA